MVQMVTAVVVVIVVHVKQCCYASLYLACKPACVHQKASEKINHGWHGRMFVSAVRGSGAVDTL